MPELYNFCPGRADLLADSTGSFPKLKGGYQTICSEVVCFISFVCDLVKIAGMKYLSLFLLLNVLALSSMQTIADEIYCQWTLRQDDVRLYIDKPLCGIEGRAEAGRQLVKQRENTNCLACHRMPIPEEDFHGEIGPPLHGVGNRYTKAELRVRLVDEKLVNPDTIMPGFYRQPDHNHRLLGKYFGKTLLTAQQVEDILAYLVTLKDDRL